MGVEQHSYGSVFCGIPRRLFVASSCAAGCVVMGLQLMGALVYNILYSVNESQQNCVGMGCYEVFSCRGMKDTTQQIREPFAELFGLVAFFLGFLGAFYGTQWNLEWAGKMLRLLGAAYIAMAVFDLTYTPSCDAYTPNMIKATLAPFSRLPPSPLGYGTQKELRSMWSYPMSTVSGITGGFPVVLWYIAVAGAWAGAVLYIAWEASFLSQLVERGPLGLGVNYGLNQWDEVINHDAIRIQKERMRASQFINDAQLPLPYAVPEEETRGYSVQAARREYADYGAAGQMNYKLAYDSKTPTPFLAHPDIDVGHS